MNIIPLGEECYVAGSIDNKFNNSNFRKIAYPFDYVGHTFIDSIIKKINSGLVVNENDIQIMPSENLFFLCDKTVDFRYWHYNTQKEEFDSEKIKAFLETINRRYDRFKKILYSNEKIIFITGQHFDFIYKKKNRKNILIKLYNTLKKINKNIIMLAFNYNQEIFTYENLHHFNFTINYDIDVKLSKESFINEFNSKINDILINYL